MVRTAILVGTLVALATAIPQHAEHLSKAQITRVNQVFARDNGVFDLAGRGVSTDGSCGTAGGLTCPQGTCCSSLGWCGSTPLHCGTGCQSGFGKCGTDDSSATSPAPVAPASTPVSTPVTVPAANNPTTQNAPAAAAAAPVNTSPQQSSAQSTGLGDNYKQYSGDGSTGAGWPSQDQWADFETAFSANKALMKVSCSQFGQANPSDSEIQTVHDSIVSTASASGIDSRYILAIVMQESKGCVRAPTTNWGVRNPGLMQSFNGQGTCNDGGSVQNPCPSSEISQMISDGTAGTGAGSNSLVYALGRAGTSDVSQYYKAARVYNSGSIAGSGQLQDGIATHCYSSDVANRLTGWVNAAHSCSFDG